MGFIFRGRHHAVAVPAAIAVFGVDDLDDKLPILAVGVGRIAEMEVGGHGSGKPAIEHGAIMLA